MMTPLYRGLERVASRMEKSRRLIVAALLGAALTGSSTTARPLALHAQACTQPSTLGCAIEPGLPVEAALTRAEDAHLWRLAVPAGGDVEITLAGLPADYRLYVYGPGGSLIGVSNEDGLVDEVVTIASADPGEYQVFVDSPRGETSARTYRLTAAISGGLASSEIPVPVAPAPGAVLFADNFENPSAGALPRSSAEPTHYFEGYVDGEYRVQVLDPTYGLLRAIYIPGTFGDSSLAVDVRLTGEPGSQTVILACRLQPGDESQYRFFVNPETRTFRLFRRDSATGFADLAPLQPSAAIRRGNAVNRLQITCAGDTISASINGLEVASVRDGTYSTGRMWFGTGTTGVLGDLRFDNLLIRQEAPRVADLPAQVPADTAILADNFADVANGWLPRSSSEAPQAFVGYVEGEYQVRIADPRFSLLQVAYLPGIYADASLAVEVRALGNPPAQSIVLACRQQSTPDASAYRLFVSPAGQSFRLFRRDGASSVDFAPLQESPAIRGGNQTNRLELTCARNTISATINGVVVATAQDSAYGSGEWWLGTGVTNTSGELRFDNLVLTRR